MTAWKGSGSILKMIGFVGQRNSFAAADWDDILERPHGGKLDCFAGQLFQPVIPGCESVRPIVIHQSKC